MLIDSISLILFVGYLSYWFIKNVSNTINANQQTYKQKYGILKYTYENGFDYYYR